MPRAFGYYLVASGESDADVAKVRVRVEEYCRSRLPSHVWGGFVADAADWWKLGFSERPGGYLLRTSVEDGDVVVVAKGAARAFHGASDLEFVASRMTLHLLDVGLIIDPATPAGRYALKTLRLAQDVDSAVSAATGQQRVAKMREAGRALNGNAGFGYRYAGPRGSRRRVPDSESLKTAAVIFEMRTAGAAWETIYLRLLKKQFNTGGRRWSIKRIMRAYEWASKRSTASTAPPRCTASATASARRPWPTGRRSSW
jgi:hypothetical protein